MGSASTLAPLAARRVGTMTTHSSVADDHAARRELSRRSCAARRGRGRDAAPALGDHAGALEHREEAAGRFARGSRELGDVGLRDGDEHVAWPGALALRAGATSPSSTVATRLWTVWNDWRARRSLASRRRRPSAMTSLTAMSGVLGAAGGACREPRMAMACDLVERLDRGRAQLVVEHRQLAEDVARAEVRQRDHAPVGMLADRARVAGAHDVARVAGVALAEDHVMPGEGRAAPPPRPRAAGRPVPASRRPAPAPAVQRSPLQWPRQETRRARRGGSAPSAARRRTHGARRAPRAAWRSRSARPARPRARPGRRPTSAGSRRRSRTRRSHR